MKTIVSILITTYEIKMSLIERFQLWKKTQRNTSQHNRTHHVTKHHKTNGHTTTPRQTTHNDYNTAGNIMTQKDTPQHTAIQQNTPQDTTSHNVITQNTQRCT